ncbi:Protein kinase [Spraguea lophii 42_110]|uniref:Protein kinase n=1 Tax=Spraguea lophii (strain 42_110) TaxID=1358809 RepID=S7W7E4_SPRLO|nr:Protein kinase [Spraguea lophii 42_110]
MILFIFFFENYCGSDNKFPDIHKRKTKHITKRHSQTLKPPIPDKKESTSAEMMRAARSLQNIPFTLLNRISLINKEDNDFSELKKGEASGDVPIGFKRRVFSKVITKQYKSRPHIFLPKFQCEENSCITYTKHRQKDDIMRSIFYCKKVLEKKNGNFMEKAYREIGKIGEGSFGSVYLYETKGCKAPLIGKYTHIKNIFCRGFQEYEVCKLLIDLKHESIIRIYEVFHGAKNMLILMELKDGYNLYKIVNHYNLHYDFKREIMAQVAAGIVFLHENDIVHGDLSPNNIMIGLDGKAKIIDFGFSCILEQGKEIGLQSIINEYTSPERVMGIYRQSDDYYSLGICIFYIHEERYPYYRSYLQELYYCKTPILFSFNLDSPNDEIDIVLKMTRYELAYRLGSREEDVETMRNHVYFKGTSFEKKNEELKD